MVSSNFAAHYGQTPVLKRGVTGFSTAPERAIGRLLKGVIAYQ